MKEATFWIPRTGHTKDKEIEVFEAASSRLMVDLDVDESIKRLFDTREGFIEYLEGLAKDSVADAAPDLPTMPSINDAR